MTLRMSVCLGALWCAHVALAQTPATSPAARPAPGEANGAGVSRTTLLLTAPAAACALQDAGALIPEETRALVLIDQRLQALVATALLTYVRAAAERRQFRIAVLPILNLDDCKPPEIRRALQSWHAAKPKLEGILFVGNVKLPSFFMPRVDIPSTRLWPRYYEDMDMVASRKVAPGTVLTNEPGRPWPAVAGVKSFKVPEHDLDFIVEAKPPGPAMWAAFLPVGFQDEARNNYQEWAGQLAPFFKKAAAFHAGRVAYGRGIYLVSNDIGLLARSKPAWDAIGPGQIEYYSINEEGPGAFKDNPAGYQRAHLEKYATLEDFLGYAKKLPWMDEGWQVADVFLRHAAQSRRRIVWWNVHSNPEFSLVTWQQARAMREGGLIAFLNGCSVGGFRQPGSTSYVDTKTTPERNLLANLVYGQSAFVAALGSTHDRVTDERATPFLQHLYQGGYLGLAHLLRERQQQRDAGANMFVLREFQELLLGDPFADAK
jgi:hypothetical protein